MQKIILEKYIDLNNELKEVLSLSVDESINYKMEQVGIRAIGTLSITGEYLASKEERFESSIDLDVLANFDKIIDQRDFHITVEDFSYVIQNGNLHVRIQAGVHGVISGQDRYVQDHSVDEIEDLMRENEKEILEVIEATSSREEEQEIVETKEEVIEMKEEVKEEVFEEVVYPSKKRQFFEDDSDSIGTYYLYIAKLDDTYESVASYYQVDCNNLMEYNHYKEISSGTTLIVPYMP